MSAFPAHAADEALTLLGELIRIDTSNPPGNEAAAAQLLAGRLAADGYEPTVIEAAPGRSNPSSGGPATGPAEGRCS